MAFQVPEIFRFAGPKGSNNGAFKFKKDGVQYRIVASDGGFDGQEWEHVSVTLDRKRCPDWEEMCMIKDLFWDKEDCVVQFHPPESEYISNHKYCLHLWRPVNQTIPMPPKNYVGLSGAEKKDIYGT